MDNSEQGLIEHFVKAGEVHVSRNKKHVISIIGLGSCVGVVAFDSLNLVGGVAHIQLPYSKGRTHSLNSSRIFACADKGIPELLSRLKAAGASFQRLFVMLVGGAQVISKGEDFFKVGELNQEACVKVLKKYGLKASENRLGGKSWRSIKLYVDAGQISIQSKGREVELLEISEISDIETASVTKITINNVRDIDADLAHAASTKNGSQGTAPTKLGEIKRTLSGVLKKETALANSNRTKTKIRNLEELKQALSHLTQENFPKEKDHN